MRRWRWACSLVAILLSTAAPATGAVSCTDLPILFEELPTAATQQAAGTGSITFDLLVPPGTFWAVEIASDSESTTKYAMSIWDNQYGQFGPRSSVVAWGGSGTEVYLEAPAPVGTVVHRRATPASGFGAIGTGTSLSGGAITVVVGSVNDADSTCMRARVSGQGVTVRRTAHMAGGFIFSHEDFHGGANALIQTTETPIPTFAKAIVLGRASASMTTTWFGEFTGLRQVGLDGVWVPPEPGLSLLMVDGPEGPLVGTRHEFNASPPGDYQFTVLAAAGVLEPTAVYGVPAAL